MDSSSFLQIGLLLFVCARVTQERSDLSSTQPAMMRELWTALNTSWYGYFHSRTPADMLGVCNEPCARKKWTALSGGANLGGPVCGVPGCTSPGSNHFENDRGGASAPEKVTSSHTAILSWPQFGAPKADWVGGNRPPFASRYN